jgi:predicted transcriptional regulator
MIENVAEIVAAFVKRNPVPSAELPALIISVRASLTNLGQAPPASPPSITPAVSIRQSIRPDHLVCLACGQKSKMLKRHLSTAHGMTPQEYRAKWDLRKDYPMTAPNYAAQRSQLAKQLGLGSKGRRPSPHR